MRKQTDDLFGHQEESERVPVVVATPLSGTLMPFRADNCAIIEQPCTFEDFWEVYPRRVAKEAARKAFTRIVCKGIASPGDIIAGAIRYANERSQQDPTYTKHPATWLNGHCWQDEPEPRSTDCRRPRPGVASAALGIEAIFGDSHE